MIFDVREGEKKLVLMAVLLCFAAGLADLVMTVAPLTLFLRDFSADLLPSAYVGVGCLTFLLGQLLRPVQNHFSLSFSFFILYGFLTCCALGIWGASQRGMEISYLYFIWAGSAFTLSNFVTTLLITHVLTLQEAKRLVGLLSGSRILGQIVAGAFLPLFASGFGFENTTLILALCFLGCLLAAMWGKRLDFKRFGVKEEVGRVSFFKMENKGYLIAILVFPLISVLSYYTLSLLFNTELKMRYPNTHELGAFLSFFTVGVSTLSMLVSVFLFSKLMARFGLGASLLITPVVLFTMLVLTWLQGNSAFIMLTATVFVENVLRVAINQPAMQLLYQPLKHEDKNWVLLKGRTIMQPLSIILSGALLAFVSQKLGVSITVFALLVMGMTVCTFFIRLVMKKQFVHALDIAITKRALFDPVFVTLDKETLDVMKKTLKGTPYPEEVLYILETLETLNLPEFFELIEREIGSEHPEVREFCLAKAVQYNIPGCREVVLQKIEQDKQALSKTLTLLKGTTEEKIQGLHLLKQLETPQKQEIALKMLQDASPEVRSAAALLIEGKVEAKFFPALIEARAHFQLFSQGSALVSYLEEHFDKLSSLHKADMVRILGELKMGATLCLPLLKEHGRLFYEAIKALHRMDYTGNVKVLLKRELEHVKRCKGFITEMGELEPAASFVQREIEIGRERSFYLLSFLHEEAAIDKVLYGYEYFDVRRRDFAVELMLQTLPREEADTVREMMEEVVAHGTSEKAVEELFAYASECALSSIPSACAFTLRRRLSSSPMPRDIFLEETERWLQSPR